MTCISRKLREREFFFEKEATWNKILGAKQKCSIIYCTEKGTGLCTNKEYYEQFEISGIIIACVRRGDDHLLNVTKDIHGNMIMEHRRKKLPTGIRD